jgi:hypothetical protein
MLRPYRVLLLALATTPFLAAIAQQTADKQAPTSDQVYKNIQVFKGVPASDLIPAMEFMSASLKYECSDCHDVKDFSIETPTKETARKMVIMQRDINTKNFNGRLEVTCNSCHGGQEHPAGTPIPEGVSLRHPRLESPPKPEDLFAKHIAAAGKQTGPMVRKGTLTAPNDVTHKVETTPLEFTQAPGGKFRLVAGERKVGSDGKQVWYGAYAMTDEPAAIFGRIGRNWSGDAAFAGLERLSISGKEVLGKNQAVVVRASNPGTTSTQEFYFDPKSNLLVRLMNARRSTLGTVISVLDYSNYKSVGGVQLPMKVVATFAGGEKWIMDFKSAKVDPSVTDAAFKPGR